MSGLKASNHQEMYAMKTGFLGKLLSFRNFNHYNDVHIIKYKRTSCIQTDKKKDITGN